MHANKLKSMERGQTFIRSHLKTGQSQFHNRAKEGAVAVTIRRNHPISSTPLSSLWSFLKDLIDCLLSSLNHDHNMDRTPLRASFSDIPVEVLRIIDNHLDAPSRVALRFTNSGIYRSLPSNIPGVNPRNGHACGAGLCMSHLNIEKSNPYRRCAFCTQRYPLENFLGGHSHEYVNRESEERLADRKLREQDERDFLDRKGFGFFGTPGMVSLPDDVCFHHKVDFVLAKSDGEGCVRCHKQVVCTCDRIDQNKD
jgi:hypothetical protein